MKNKDQSTPRPFEDNGSDEFFGDSVFENLEKKSWALGERIKELNCLYSTTNLLQQHGASFKKILGGIVDLLPPAWQYPDITCGRIVYGSYEIKTTNFTKTIWKQKSNIIAQGRSFGSIEVFYLEERPQAFEGPFLKEERDLIDSLANLLSQYKIRADDLEQSWVASIVNNSHDAIIGKSLEGIITSWNPAAEKLYGYSVDEVVGKHILLLVPYGKKGGIEGFLETLRRDNSIKHLETDRVRKDGSTIRVMLTISPVKDSSGNIIGASTIAKDITQLREIKKKSRKQQESLIQSAKMASLGTLVAGVAHEINNPVNLIMLHNAFFMDLWRDINPVLESLASDDPEKEYGGLTYENLKTRVDHHLTDVMTAAQQIEGIVKRLKDFSTPYNAAPLEPVNINNSIKNAVELSRPTIRKSGAVVKLNLSDEIPPVMCAYRYIDQVVLNLIINARQAIKHNSGIIEIFSGVDGRRKNVFISVKDNGKGIDPSVADKVFDPFVTTRQPEGGTGLGLSISYQMVKSYGGEITFKSRPGMGATFTVTQPISPKRKRGRILIADDEAAIRDPMKKILERSGLYEVQTVSTGFEACVKLGSWSPDLLVLDIHMPDMNGLDVCRSLKADEEFKDIKVIIITGYPEGDLLENIRQLGFTNLYQKPLELKKLKKDIDSLFN